MDPPRPHSPARPGGGRGEPFDGNFDRIIACICVRLCLDWDVVEEGWDLLRYYAVQHHWRKVAPPLDVTSAALAGWKPPRAVNSERGSLEQLAKMFEGSGGTIQ